MSYPSAARNGPPRIRRAIVARVGCVFLSRFVFASACILTRAREPATLDALPPELVRRIVEHAVPDAFHSSTFPQRQQTLASLSRVCSRFRAIALDRLCEIVHIRSSDVKTLERTCKLFASRKSRSLVKEVVVNDNWADTLSLPVFITFIQDCANLETLAINRWSADVIVFPAKGVFQCEFERDSMRSNATCS